MKKAPTLPVARTYRPPPRAQMIREVARTLSKLPVDVLQLVHGLYFGMLARAEKEGDTKKGLVPKHMGPLFAELHQLDVKSEEKAVGKAVESIRKKMLQLGPRRAA